MELAPKLPNSLKSEHLTNGEKPIMVSYGLPTSDTIESRVKTFLRNSQNSRPIDINGVDNISFDSTEERLREHRIKNGGLQTYVMSEINNRDKFTGLLLNCTSLIVTGRDKKTGENISFITHQKPEVILWDEPKESDDKKREEIIRTKKLLLDQFVSSLVEQLTDIKNKCEEGSIDAVLVGGNYYKPDVDDDKYIERYKATISRVGDEVKKQLGFPPVVVGGPKVNDDYDHMYYENENRQVYFIRETFSTDLNTMEARHPVFQGEFTSDDIEKASKDWLK